MRISDCMKQYLPDISFETVREKDVVSLGLLVSEANGNLCSFIDDEKYLTTISSKIDMLFTTKELAESMNDLGYIIVDKPRNTFFQLHNALKNDMQYVRSDFATQIDSSAIISKQAVVPEKNVSIGKNVIIEPFAVIYENTVIEDNCIIRSGAIIGGAGFEQKRDGNSIFAVEHLGGTIISHDVEIQNNTCVDRAVFPWDNTMIGPYTKIDNLVHIGHAAKIGSCCMIVAQTGVGGRVVVGDHVWLGFGATIRNGLLIGEGARVNMGSVVSKNVLPGEQVTGNFAIPHEKFLENLKNSIKK